MSAAPRRRRTTTEQGLGWEHQKRRRALLPLAYGTPCPLCGEVMLRGQRLDLDHSLPRALGGTVGDRMAHSKCNQSAGAKLGNALRNRKPSRRWY